MEFSEINWLSCALAFANLARDCFYFDPPPRIFANQFEYNALYYAILSFITNACRILKSKTTAVN